MAEETTQQEDHDNNPYTENDSPLSDSDQRAGGTENSPEYDRLYNPKGGNESARFGGVENANYLEEQLLIRRQNEYLRNARSELSNALTRVQFRPFAGRFIIPKEETFAAHLLLVREGNTVNIHFNPSNFVYFDKIIADAAKRPDLFDPKHPNYKKYEPLRENIAVLRNAIMGCYMKDGSFDPGDERYIPKIEQIAFDIGKALRVDNSLPSVVFPSLNSDMLNVEGEGAAHVYEFLRERQTSNTIIGHIYAGLVSLMGQPKRMWNLPPIETTAFSAHGLVASAPEDDLCNSSSRAMHQRCQQIAQEQIDAFKASENQAAVDEIHQNQRLESVHHGKIILDWLRNIQFSDKSLMDFVDTGNPTQTAPERDAINMLVDAYYDIASQAFQNNPNLFNQPKIQAANDALETIEHALQLMAKLEKPKSMADTMQISTDETQQPDKWNELSKHTVQRLMDTLKGGLEEVVGAMEAQAQDYQQQQDEMADRQVDTALANHASFSKGRKKRKAASSGKGAVKQEKVRQALTADDRAAGQGIYATQRNQEAKTIARTNTQPMRDNTTARNQPPEVPIGSSVDAQMARARMQLQGVDVGVQAPVQPSMIDSALVKQLGKAMLQMQKDSDAASANLPPEVANSVNDQSNTQRVAENKTRNNNRPKSV